MRATVALLALLLSACAGTPPASTPAASLASTPAEEAAVRAAVQRLFDAMRAGDSTAARAFFHPDATMISVGVRDGATAIQKADPNGFIRAIGTPHDKTWDERIANLQVRVDANLATAWMDYAFYLGGEFSHCGVNAVEMVRVAEGWKAIHLADTRRREQCAPQLRQ
jgi:ketosteroid isomerase-like protein